jgi:aspartyl protease family protein
MLWIAWIFLLVLLWMFFRGREAREENPNQRPTSYLDAQNNISVLLTMNRENHYVITGTINNEPVSLFLDTGASYVSIPLHLAQRLSLKAGQPITLQTAAGPSTAYLTEIDRLTLGDIVLNNITAILNPNVTESQVLLGMSALKALSFKQTGRTLSITQSAPSNAH